MLGIHIRAQWLMRTLFTFLCRIRHRTASFTFFTRITCWIAGAFVQGRCQRTDPPCKYLHPPQHLKEQLLQNGRNNLIMRNLNQLQRIQPLPPTAALYSFVRICKSLLLFLPCDYDAYSTRRAISGCIEQPPVSCQSATSILDATLLLYAVFVGWLGSRVVSVLDSGAEGSGFKSQPRRCRVTVLGKLFTPIVPLFTKQRNW